MTTTSDSNLAEIITGVGELEIHDDVGPSSGEAKERIIIVANQLPVRATRAANDHGWKFKWDNESLLFKLKDGLPDAMEVIYVGSLPADVDPTDLDDITSTLLTSFNCVLAFLPPDLKKESHNGFSEQCLSPLLHSTIPISNRHGRVFDRSLWDAYVLTNEIFQAHVKRILRPASDYVWIHDYHLMLLPFHLRREVSNLRMGFFLHSPFPSFEVFRSLPVREELIKCLLNCDLIGFHSHGCAWHFLDVCLRLIGLEHHMSRGYITLEYHGHTIGIKISPVGIHLPEFKKVTRSPELEFRLSRLKKQFASKTVLLGLDVLDLTQAIDLKLLAFEHMLEMDSSLQGKAVLLQLVKPAAPRNGWNEFDKAWNKIQDICKRINEKFGGPGYHPVVCIHSYVSSVEKIAYYAVAECFVVTAMRDEMILTPYEYILCRDEVCGNVAGAVKTSALVVSEFIRCSRSLSGAIWINPWNIVSTAKAMHKALTDSETEKQLRHEKNHRYVSTHDVAYWSKSFFEDLQRSCKDHRRKRSTECRLKVMSLDPEFNKVQYHGDLSNEFEKVKRRVIFLDHDNTFMPQENMDKKPSEDIIRVLKPITTSVSNVVYIISGKQRRELAAWFRRCKRLGIAAEHGFYLRSSANEEWETCCKDSDFRWMQKAEQLLKHYTEVTNGSHIEIKETALAWHHKAADPYLVRHQTLELLDHLERDLANEAVEVTSGRSMIEIKPKGVSEGLIVEKILKRACDRWGEAADFVLWMGDDRWNEDMFDSIISVVKDGKLVAENASVFGCAVAQNSGQASYFWDHLASHDDTV